jgi:hypothetical protein
MFKHLVSAFFLILFLAFIAAPTIIHTVDDTIDISSFYSISEEEERGHETIKNFEIKLCETEKFCISIVELEKEKSYASYVKNYIPYTIECVSPPPKLS